ncbi:MAG: hypothetical protein ACOCRK_02910 [bacterium]
MGGYQKKRGTSVLQSLYGDKHGTDCGTKKYRTVHVTEDNQSEYIDAYMIKGKELVLLNYDNIKNYIGKDINIRYPMGCTTEKICNICLGERYYKLLNEYDKPINVGIPVSKVFTELTQKSLKKTHKMTLEYYVVNDLNEFIV